MGSYHGFNVYNVADPLNPELQVSVVCPGGLGDLSVRGYLLFMSVEETRGRLDCGFSTPEEAVEPVDADRFRGVRIFDNSVSTQVESTLSALTSLPGRVHWVGGGKSKDGRFAEPGRELSSHVCTAHLFGRAAAPLGSEMASQVPTTVHDDLEHALAAAWSHCRAGDSILFSPAFASFDQFPNFAARAARFADWVHRLKSAQPTTTPADAPASHR